jgi:hypothetical protein
MRAGIHFDIYYPSMYTYVLQVVSSLQAFDWDLLVAQNEDDLERATTKLNKVMKEHSIKTSNRKNKHDMHGCNQKRVKVVTDEEVMEQTSAR